MSTQERPIEQICSDVEEQLNTGQHVDFDECLTVVKAEQRGDLLSHLLVLQQEYAAEPPAEDDCVRRYPDHVSAVRKAFDQSVSVVPLRAVRVIQLQETP